MDKKNINIILATDCGSTTTKAILIEYIENESISIALVVVDPQSVAKITFIFFLSIKSS